MKIIRNASHKSKKQLKQIIDNTSCNGIYLGYIEGIMNNRLKYQDTIDMPIFSINDIPKTELPYIVRCQKTIDKNFILQEFILELLSKTPNLIVGTSEKETFKPEHLEYALPINSKLIINKPYKLENIKYYELLKYTSTKIILEPPFNISEKDKAYLMSIIKLNNNNLSIITGNPTKIRKLIKASY